jgi:hypothetical protein
MRRGIFFSFLRDDELSLGVTVGCVPTDDVRAGLAVDLWLGGGGMMPSKLSFMDAGGVGGSACLGGLMGMAGIGGAVRGT